MYSFLSFLKDVNTVPSPNDALFHVENPSLHGPRSGPAMRGDKSINMIPKAQECNQLRGLIYGGHMSSQVPLSRLAFSGFSLPVRCPHK